MTDTKVTIQIYFTQAIYVSANEEPDEMRLSVNDELCFVSQNLCFVWILCLVQIVECWAEPRASPNAA